MLDNNSDFNKLVEKYNLKRFNCCVYYNNKICVVDISTFTLLDKKLNEILNEEIK